MSTTARGAVMIRSVCPMRVLLLLGALLACVLSLPGRCEETPKAAAPSSTLTGLKMTVLGPEQAAVGTGCTVEVLIHNTGAAAVKDLDVLARMSAHLEQDIKGQDRRLTVEPIGPHEARVVRFNMTPRKETPGEVDITLRANDGATKQIRHTFPVVAAHLAELPPTKDWPLRFRIFSPRQCFADQPTMVLLQVRNPDFGPRGGLHLVVEYAPGLKQAVPGSSEERGRMTRPATPVRKLGVTIPVLGAGESFTVPIFPLTPRRIGEFEIAVTGSPAPPVASSRVLASTRISVKFDPSLSVADMVPVRSETVVGNSLPGQLVEVPELSLQDPFSATLPSNQAFENVVGLIEKVNHVNAKKTDTFVETLIAKRADMKGLPFTMGDACRLSPARSRQFVTEIVRLRDAMGSRNGKDIANVVSKATRESSDSGNVPARIAALMQILAHEDGELPHELVKCLAGTTHADATRALARLAIFSEEEQIRKDAVAALATRTAKDYDEALLNGLNYPWPAVAQRAADGIVALKRKDLVPQLIDMLDRPDPRLPQLQARADRTVPIVRELVRINHLRNCLLCHAPANAPVKEDDADEKKERQPIQRVGSRSRDRLPQPMAPVPIPGERVPSPVGAAYYGESADPDMSVKFDVTYLRQDFSVLLKVEDAKPWPSIQRFDFTVRTREVTAKEATALRELLNPARPGDLTPYQRTAHEALRQLTGQNAEPTAAAWRLRLNRNAEKK